MAFESTVIKSLGRSGLIRTGLMMFMELDFKPAKRPVEGMMLGRK